jgi:hypothetical protein
MNNIHKIELELAELNKQKAELKKKLAKEYSKNILKSLIKLNKLSGNNFVHLNDYISSKGLRLLYVVLNTDERNFSYRYNNLNNVEFEVTLEDYKYIHERVDERLKKYLPLEPYFLEKEEIAEIRYTDSNESRYNRTEGISAMCLHDLFIQFYEKNRRLRYCNGCRYSFVDSKLSTAYNEWYKLLPSDMSFNLYYGSGIVD